MNHPTTPPTRTILMQIPIWDFAQPAPAAGTVIQQHQTDPESTVSSSQQVLELPQAEEGRATRGAKSFRLPSPLTNALRRVAYTRTLRTGIRVTETSLLIEALEAYLAKAPEQRTI